MRSLVLFSVLAVVLAGCSSSDSGNEAGPNASASKPRSSAAAPGPAAAMQASVPRALATRTPALPHRATGGGFALAPDRGDLVAYPAKAQILREGAYTWHRADLSEAHAIASIVGGHLSLTAPSGEKLDFRYERHVEHASGDWTWVGRSQHGAASDEAIITFGEHAAFGRISQPGKLPLRLTIRDGKAWLVETDPSKIAMIDSAATKPTRPDYLLPTAAAATATSSSAATFALDAAPMADAAPTVIDVVLGYTNGFAAGLGGSSQAVTRLNFVMEVTNNGYINSQISARVRLVGTVQVNYPDNTDNGDALEKLTGTRTVPVDPAFNALRAARDQYGADLVSLVRKFTRPENNGCGIAWLNGGGQRGVSVGNADNGYSVVSDGRSPGTGGTTYFCSDDTLAHEMGHNMGAQHDRDTASSSGTLQYGAFAYSFGYKQGGASGFHTIMAYGDEGQRGYLVFSNPRISFCGSQLCGVADSADNARTLTQTIPVVAQFRATVVPPGPARFDINADGKSDVTWYNQTAGQLNSWVMSGNSVARSWVQQISPTCRPRGLGDMSGDGKLDVAWTCDNGTVWMWTGDGSSYSQQYVGGFVAGWYLAGATDVNGDGKTDLVWYNTGSGYVNTWLMDGASIVQSWFQSISPTCTPKAFGDFDGNAKSDIAWTCTNGTVWIWQGGSTAYSQVYVGGFLQGWAMAGSADINGDGRSDVLWHNQAAGQLNTWLMNGASIMGNWTQQISPTCSPKAFGDYDATGRYDVLWTCSNNTVWLWSSQGNSYTQQYVGGFVAGWEVVY